MENLKLIIIGLFLVILAGVVVLGIIDMAFIAEPYSDTFVVADKYIDNVRKENSLKEVSYKQVHYMVFANDRMTIKNAVSIHTFYKYNVNDTVILENMKLGIFSYTSAAKVRQ